MASSVSAVYIQVVDDVISKMREDFINFGAGESVLSELQALWEMKMIHCGAVSGNIERSSVSKTAGGPIIPVHDLNVPYEGPTEEYETPTAEMLFPPTPMQTPIQTPLPGTADQSLYNIPTGPSDYAGTPISDMRNSVDTKGGRSSPYMQPPSPWLNQRSLGVDVNVAYVEGREDADRGASQQPTTQEFFMPASKRKRDDYPSNLAAGGYLPQQDGSGDVPVDVFLAEANQAQDSQSHSREAANNENPTVQEGCPSARIPQGDGHDEYDDMFHYQGVASEDYNTPGGHAEFQAATPVATPKPAKNETADDDEPPLNEDDDDDDLDDLDDVDELQNTQHLVLAQFDKVSRTKSRWKCILKDGIMHLNGRDILFNKATGEFEF